MQQSFSPRTVGSQDPIGFLTLETLVLGKKPVTECGTGPRGAGLLGIDLPPTPSHVPHLYASSGRSCCDHHQLQRRKRERSYRPAAYRSHKILKVRHDFLDALYRGLRNIEDQIAVYAVYRKVPFVR
ncbi:MAG: hypothetical protein QOI22_1675 [Verrucomicrobiota bacterium]